MRAILPGRPQSKRQALCTAHWDGLRLVAYISGNIAVILRDPKDIIQTISIDHVETLCAITIDESSGRIALCNEQRVLIFDPLGRDQGDLRWTQTQDIAIPDNGTVRSLSWGASEEILIGGTQLWLYHIPDAEEPKLIWQQPVANEVAMAYFSNDAELIASCGIHDRLVKIWRRLSFEVDATRFDVSYLPHPSAVTDLHWRKPWHKEQNLDTLLYTFCSDNQIRIWTYSDPHSITVVQLIATIDANAAIEPRRRSIGSMSRKRYVFIFDSRDFSHATERAIQRSHNQSVDHALEHLIEIANRSPELCVVFDGLGHMSVWGLENAGCKSKSPAAVFNIMLVDQVDIQLSFGHDQEADFTRLLAFGGGVDQASLSLLVHSYTGQIDWYESPIAHFFGTASRIDRVKLLSSWSGHDLPIDHIARGSKGDQILSWSDKGQAIVWSQSPIGALRRRCEIDTDHNILSIAVIDAAGFVLILYPDAISLWNVKQAHGSEVAMSALDTGKGPISLQIVGSVPNNPGKYGFILNYKEDTQEVWQVVLPGESRTQSTTNGNYTLLERLRETELDHKGMLSIPSDHVSTNQQLKPQEIQSSTVRIDRDGRVIQLSIELDASSSRPQQRTPISFDTNLRDTILERANSSGKCAIVAKNKRTLTIWDMYQGVCEWQYECEGIDEIQKLVWNSTPQGNLFLFVGFSYSALFVGQFRYPMLSVRQAAWYVTQNLSLRDFTTNHVGDVCWLSSGDIAVAAGNQIFVVENVITEHQSPIIRKSQQLVQNESAAAVIDMANAALPIFRADFLEALLLEGGLEHAEFILRTLYEKLKYFSEGDNLESDLGLSRNVLMFPKHDKLTNGVTQANGSIGNHSSELEEIEGPFKEYLEKADLWQLGPKRRQDISHFLVNLIKIGKYRKSFDENALRYIYALHSTPPDRDLPWSAFVFASRSTSQEALVEIIMQGNDGKLTWNIARRTGLFVWLTDLVALRTHFENVARAEYNKHEDRNPINCSLHYLALNKKPVLLGLWRMTYGNREKENTMKLLANNFEEPRWKATALKNAYALLSKRRFEYAAAFFLLGSSLKDAVNVCVNQLRDIQLAIAVARVWDKDVQESEQVLRDLIEGHVLDMAIDNENGRWMAAWAYSTLDQPIDAIRSLVRPLHQLYTTDLKDFDGPIKSMSFRNNDPHLNILYLQLRQTFVKQNKWTTEVLSLKEEHNFVLRCARWWTRAGMDHLALRLLRDWQFISHQEPRRANAPTTLVIPVVEGATKSDLEEDGERSPEEAREVKKKPPPPPTQFLEPSADSLLDSFGF